MADHAALTAGNVAVISGAANGIGFAAARRFTGLGMRVLLADIDGVALEQAATALDNIPHAPRGRIATYTLDVADFSQVCALKEYAYATFGQVDVLMNNAGTGEDTRSWDSLPTWRRIIDVNMWGVIHGIQAFTQAMIDQHTPALIINTGSKQGITNPPGNPAYNVSKAAVKSATESLQHELRNSENCHVSAHLLVPGFTYTGLIKSHFAEKPAGAWEPSQVADYMVKAINRGSFYIICPDNEVSAAEDARRMMWAAGDVVQDRSPLSRWDAKYREAFKAFKLTGK